MIAYVELRMGQIGRSGQMLSQHWLPPLPWGRRSPAWSGRTWWWGRRPEGQRSPQDAPSQRYQQLGVYIQVQQQWNFTTHEQLIGETLPIKVLVARWWQTIHTQTHMYNDIRHVNYVTYLGPCLCSKLLKKCFYPPSGALNWGHRVSEPPAWTVNKNFHVQCRVSPKAKSKQGS